MKFFLVWLIPYLIVCDDPELLLEVPGAEHELADAGIIAGDEGVVNVGE